ncbi:glycosyltransferase [Anaerobacillus alkaliphilus]|uniref:Glycosyltransferase n=1 Tax=Anaerobacillus alkaliphilus TaxID=1548597 RepID=A0A4Q0VSZ1_9BACI|nr:glycosyltransferase [Anaerobacillus alkaliphilus]RXJ01672.1 glycosyltransferase [Anaerobacillus alkaliphilus]
MDQNKLKDFLSTTLANIAEKRTYIESLNNLSKISVKGFSKDFFIDKPINILFQYNHQVLTLDNEKVYLSLFEKTTNFTKKPIEPNSKLFGNVLLVDADFTIKNSVTCILSIIFYDQEQPMKTFKFQHKGDRLTQKIHCPQNSVSYRVAIKLEGTGQFQNQKFEVEQRFEREAENQQIHAQYVTNTQLCKKSKVETFKAEIKNYKYFRRRQENDLKLAVILDEFSFDCFTYDCQIVSLTKSNWQNEILHFQPDFLFVESSWQGNKGEWAYEIANLHVNKHRTCLLDLVTYCKEIGLPTVFWDKEGFENYEFFKEAASYFDYIFTADENNLERFQRNVKHQQIHVLPFAAQPQLHNPINKNKNFLGEIAFAGSYYSNKHDTRKGDIENLIKPSLSREIQIFDRYFGKDPTKYPNNQWPKQYQDNIVGHLDYSEMVEAYKNFDIFLNVNSVQNSRYMFARRVYEILASKTFVISGPSLGIEEFFKGYVPISRGEDETTKLLKLYLNNPLIRKKIEKQGLRYVIQNHTYKHRLHTICQKIGLLKEIENTPKVTIITSTQRQEYMEALFENISNQTYEHFEVVIILNKNTMNFSVWQKRFECLGKPVKILQIDEGRSLGYCLNEAVRNSTGEVIAKFDDDDYYAANYLLDMVQSMEYSNADIVGKSSHYLYFEESQLLALKTIGSGSERYSNFVAGATLVFTRTIFDKLCGFLDKNRGEDTDFLTRAKEFGSIIYSNDEYNYCCLRRKNKANHTWQIGDDELLRICKSSMFTTDYKTPVTL